MLLNLPDSALSWAATRSGLPLSEYIASLTRERETVIMQDYNRWRKEHGLSETALITPSELPMPRKPAEAHDRRAVSNAELWEKATDKRHK